MKDTRPKNNFGRFPSRNYPKASRLNAVAFEEPSELDGDDEDGFDGSQYDPDDDPAYAGDEPYEGATKDETPCLGMVRLQEPDGTWHLLALQKEDSDEQVANTLERGIRDKYEGQPGYVPTWGPKSSPQVTMPAIPKVPVGTKTPKSTA